jgi:hypothetical protein
VSTTLPDNLLSAVQRVARGEKILWTGQPDARRVFLMGLGAYLFAIPWTVFSLAWESFPVGMILFGDRIENNAIPGYMPWVFLIFGIPFIAIGFYMLAIPFLARRAARQTAFFITETKLAIVTFGKNLESKVRSLTEIKRIESVEKANGSGTLKVIFGYGRDSDGDRTTDSEELTGIENVRQVEDLINSLRASPLKV